MNNSLVNVYSTIDRLAIDKVNLPDVFLSPIRIDILKFVHSNMAKNKRQPFSVNQSAGMNTSARSWGTGRAVSRVPRVPGGGTNRSGQGAVTNMCRGGRMFSPTTIWRRWHHKINKTQRKQAIMTAIASSGLVSIVSARGHVIDHIPEIPLVVEGCIESITRTKDATKVLETLGVTEDIQKKKKKKKLRTGKSKLRNRRSRKHLGPLIIFDNNLRCFKNILGVEICSIKHLNLLQLAPGGHVGRLCIWTHNSFTRLNSLFSLFGLEIGNLTSVFIPKNIVTNSNLKIIINSDKVQKALTTKSKYSKKKF